MIDTKDIEAFSPLKERLCLDFINTADEHLSEPINELLTSYARLVEWSVYVNAISEDQAEVLLTLAQQHPEKADEALRFAVRVREALFRVLDAAADHRQPEPAEMQAFNEILAQAMSHLHMTPSSANFSWMCSLDENDLETMIWPVVWSAAELMTSRDLHYLRECASEDCEWLFFGYLQKSQPPLVQYERMWQPFQSTQPLPTCSHIDLRIKTGATWLPF